MKHDIKIMSHKPKKSNTAVLYLTRNEVLTKEERLRRKERSRVDKLLSPNYFNNNNA